MKHHIKILCLLLAALCLTACAGTSQGQTPPPASTGGPAPTAAQAAGRAVTVHLPAIYVGGEDAREETQARMDSQCDYLNAIIAELGYQVSFQRRVIDTRAGWSNDASAVAVYMDEGDGVYIAAQGELGQLPRDALLELPAEAQRLIPETVALLTSYDRAGDALVLPAITYPSGSEQHMLLLVRTDIAQAFGGEISNFEGFRDFLTFAAGYGEGILPCVVPTGKWGIYMGFGEALSDIFFLREGYLPLNMSADLCLTPQGQYARMHAADPFRTMLDTVGDWQEKGLMRLMHIPLPEGYRDLVGDTQIASLLIKTAEYEMEPDYAGTPSCDLLGLDAADYTAFALYPDAYPASIFGLSQAYYYVAPKTCQPDEFLRFLDDLYHDPNVYRAVIHGREGQDYTIDPQGRVAAVEAEIPYSLRNPAQLLRMPEMEEAVPEAHVPAGYYMALREIRFQDDIPGYASYYDNLLAHSSYAVEQDATNDAYSRAVHKASTNLDDMLRALSLNRQPQATDYEWPQDREYRAVTTGEFE